MRRPRDLIILLAFTLTSAAHAAHIVKGDVSSALGPDFFFDDAVTGGGDNVATTFNRDISGYWSAGETVTLRGIGWASSGDDTKNTANSATVTFIDLGPDGVFDTPDDVAHGPVTDVFIDETAGEYLWDFDSDIVFTATGSSLRISISSNGGTLARKTTSGTGQASVKLSLAGTAGVNAPPPFTATASGFWEEISWDSGSGTSTGGFNDSDTALIGSNRTVTYRGVPAAEQLAVLNLGNISANTGQGTLKVTSGTLHVTGNLTAGRNDSANDAFVFVEGGTLHVGGDAVFGRSTGSCDGSLIVAGGNVQVDGDLAMGGFVQGGSMLRFHNPGASPPVAVGGTLTLGRCSLDLTFDSGYTHIPDTVITLATFAARVGQFLNFRQGEEFNCGPNRFRIAYSGSSITLTALTNWTQPAARPNIILLFADDGGYADMSLQGNPKFPTPQIDLMAAAGVRFTDHYMSASVCHPSRCGLLSGTYQQRFGNENNLGSSTTEGIAGNTLVVYTNDNGGAGWNSQFGGNFSYNTPLRGYKGGGTTEGAMRVPAAACWPGVIPPGQTIFDPVISLDWGATFVNASGASPVAARNGLDGLDLMPLLRDATPLPADRVLCWRMGGNTGGDSAARMGDWKMLISDTASQTDTPALYNLRSDIGENTNLAAAQPAILAELLGRFRAWESRTLPPIYGSSDTVIDVGLQHHAIGGGLRLRNDSTTPLWLSSSLRHALSTSADFAHSFLIRATEPGPYAAAAGIWHGLGDSTNRAQLIRAGIDFGASALVLAEGKNGQSASVALPSLPNSGFATAVLEYRAATRVLTLSLGGTSVSLAIPGSYSSLTHTAMGAAAIEGELTMLRAMQPGGSPTNSVATIDPTGDPLVIDLDLGNEPPFAPRMERSAGLTGFAPDPDALVEPLGGGLYRINTPASGLPTEFFRFRNDQP